MGNFLLTLEARDYHGLHDLLEELWLLESDPINKLRQQAYLQLSVALYHQQRGNQKGFEILVKKASEKLELIGEKAKDLQAQSPEQIHALLTELLERDL